MPCVACVYMPVKRYVAGVWMRAWSECGEGCSEIVCEKRFSEGYVFEYQRLELLSLCMRVW